MFYDKIKQFTGLCLLIALGGLAVFGQCSEADKKALEAFDRQWGDFSERGDRGALERIYAKDYTGIGFMNTTGRKQTIDNTVTQAQQAKTGSEKQPKLAYDTYVITCTPNTATITHRVVVKTMDDGQYTTSYSRAIHFLEKRGTDWKVVSSTGHPIEGAGRLVSKEIDGYKAYLRRDVDWFENNTADNYIGVNLSGQTVNKEQAIEAMKNDKNKYDSIKLSNVNVQMNGDVGVVTGVYHIKGTDMEGKPIDMKLRFTRTLAKEDDGIWKAVAGHTTVLNDNL